MVRVLDHLHKGNPSVHDSRNVYDFLQVKISTRGQVIDAQTDQIMEFRRVIIIDILDECESSPLVIAVFVL